MRSGSTRASSSDIASVGNGNGFYGNGGSGSGSGSGSSSVLSNGSFSSSCSAGGGALKRTCSSLSLFSDITAAAAAAADGGDLLADGDEVEPPDEERSYSPDFSSADRSASSSAAELLEHLSLGPSAAELRLASSAPLPNSAEREQTKFRRRLLAKLKRHRKSSSNNSREYNRKKRANYVAHAHLNGGGSGSLSSSSRSSSSSSAASFDSPPKPHNGHKHQTWPQSHRANGTNPGSPRGTARSSKGPFSRVRKLLRKKNRTLDLSRDTRAADLSTSDSSLSPFHRHSFHASTSPDMNSHHHNHINTHSPNRPRHFRRHAHHQFTHMCTHCGHTHTLRATLTTTLTSSRASHARHEHEEDDADVGPPLAITRSSSDPLRSMRHRNSETAEAGSPSPNPDEWDLKAVSTADDPLSGTTQYCCKKSAADSDLFPIQEGKLMLTRNPSDAFPSSYKLQLRCSHFEESLLHQWFEIDHYDPNQNDTAADFHDTNGTGSGGPHGNNSHHHTDVCEHCSAVCALCVDELSSSHSSSSAGSGESAVGLRAPLGFVARPDYVYTLDENFSFERVRVGA